MVKKCFVIHEEVIDVFHEKIYIPTIEQLSFNIFCVSIIGSMEYGKNRNYCFRENASKININSRNNYAEKFSKTTGIEIQSQHWGRNIQLSMEVIAVEYFPISIYPGSNEKYEFHSYINNYN